MRSLVRVTKKPMRKQPLMLMKKVPCGQAVPQRSLIQLPTRKRAIAPKKPPIPTSMTGTRRIDERPYVNTAWRRLRSRLRSGDGAPVVAAGGRDRGRGRGAARRRARGRGAGAGEGDRRARRGRQPAAARLLRRARRRLLRRRGPD